MEVSLQDLWNSIVKKGYYIRFAGKDGLKSWQPIKTELSEFDISFSFNKNIFNLANEMYFVHPDDNDHQNAKFIFNNIKLDNTIELHHFFIQHFRIPKMINAEKISLLKLMQIAYNAGQFLASRNCYPIEVLNFYDDNNMGKLETYIM